jgi:signal transduction histidine kinase
MKRYWNKYRTELFFYAGFLTMLGVAFSLQSIYVEPSWRGEAEPLTREIIINILVDRVIAAYLWLLLTPFIIWTAELIAERCRSFWSTFAVHLFAALFFTFIHIPVYTTYIYAVHSAVPWMYAGVFEKIPDIGFGEYLLSTMTRLNHVYRLLYYSIIIAIHFAFDYFRKYTEREVRASQLEVQLKEAQIRSLHQQLQPHFLFNTLNGISSLMYTSVEQADRMLTYLGDLLRFSLERMNVQEITLCEDIGFIERYLQIEKTRMGDRLSVTTDFHHDTLDALVPVMITQPLLENAVKHGIAPYSRPGRIGISSRRHDDTLVILVEDTGNGMAETLDDSLARGFGLKSTIDRLTLLYGTAYSLRYANMESGGLRVTLSLPFRIPSE